MRNLFLGFLLFVAACAPFRDFNNPIDRQTLYGAENAAIVVFAGLNAYKQSCVRKAIPQTCVGVVHNIQQYTLQIPPVLADLRKFVRENQTLNAITAYNTLQTLISHAKVIATANAVPMGGN